ncbi:hypothetical protein Syun_030518 [Stephania yunnanensis]|uniref:Uncharacterized protein n=1 Tax=Stephania yunnanensis TaxID=152371 RepID=A0AAP0DXC3_9MAGN
MRMSIREVAELYESEKSLLVVEAHRPLSGLHSIALIALERLVKSFPHKLLSKFQHEILDKIEREHMLTNPSLIHVGGLEVGQVDYEDVGDCDSEDLSPRVNHGGTWLFRDED